MASLRSKIPLGEITQVPGEVGQRRHRRAENSKATPRDETRSRPVDDDGCCKTCKGRHCVGRCRF